MAAFRHIDTGLLIFPPAALTEHYTNHPRYTPADPTPAPQVSEAPAADTEAADGSWATTTPTTTTED